MHLPESIWTHIAEKTGHTDNIGMSGSCITVYDDCVLKIEKLTPYTAENIETMRWLQHRVPTPKVLLHEIMDGKSYLLISRIPGKMSCDPAYLEQPEAVLRALADGLRLLWNTDPTGCPRTDGYPNSCRKPAGGWKTVWWTWTMWNRKPSAPGALKAPRICCTGWKTAPSPPYRF